MTPVGSLVGYSRDTTPEHVGEELRLALDRAVLGGCDLEGARRVGRALVACVEAARATEPPSETDRAAAIGRRLEDLLAWLRHRRATGRMLGCLPDEAATLRPALAAAWTLARATE